MGWIHSEDEVEMMMSNQQPITRDREGRVLQPNDLVLEQHPDVPLLHPLTIHRADGIHYRIPLYRVSFATRQV